METHTTNPLESIAFFEEKVPLTPRDFAEDKIKIDFILTQKLQEKLEGKCSLHGWVVPRTLKILSRSMGYVESGRFTGDIVFHVQTQGLVINPPSGVIVTGQVIRKNKMGMYVDYKNAIRIILPRDLHIGDKTYEDVQVGQYVECVIKKSRFQVNDEYILSVGDFLKVSEKTKTARTVERPPMRTVVVGESIDKTGEETIEEEKKEDEEDVLLDAKAQQVEEIVVEQQQGGSIVNQGMQGPASSDLGMQGPAASTLTPASLLQEGFVDLDVKGKSEVNPDSGPGPASLTQPRKPYHLLSDVLQDAPRDTVGCLTAGCCNETDFEARTNLTGNYLQRTNNYQRAYPDNCTGPLHDFTMAFYKTTTLKEQ